MAIGSIIQAEQTKDENGSIWAGAFLWARPQVDDFARSSAESEWSRPTPPYRFDNTCIVRCAFDREDVEPPLPPVDPFIAGLFDDPEYADVLFRVEAVPQAPLAYLLCMKRLLVLRSRHFKTVFEAGFSESTAFVRLDPAKLARKTEGLYDGDADDFGAFEAAVLSTSAVDSRELADSEQEESSPQLAVAEGDSGEVHSDASEEEPPSASPDPLARQFLQVNLTGYSYPTYRALLYYYHTHDVHFLPSVSNYLVAHHDKEELPARNEWLAAKALAQRQTPQPCSPHALYRLADEHMDDAIKKRAKGFIIRGLTVENVAYEAFCQLSIDFDDFRDSVLEFLLDKWDEVKTTKAFKQAMSLLEGGQLPGGAAILSKIFERLVVKK
ncbi:hypothetical protein JCM10207_005621 [Rhodosporidiobolus poonsookiae]